VLLTVDNMASKGLRVISCQVTRKVEACYKLSHTDETIIGYIVCRMLVFIIQSQFVTWFLQI